ncbi:terminase large subunit [Xanthomonas phage XPP1]|uniref:Terminase large subunit n=1 Tax=Xanthomonas phage XPP1 TaxID=2099853 RepID=A0A3S7HHK6_9CAUD|nr:terminase large subunit [Xanthomonas phage XPP1]AVO23717.1 terminase large subunit [Xanthomonas phage XPP2]AVO23794.1 terminase large subunit [Xanthomonas phage XPP3]AVO23884.1 terminase large subunit [Xanthomonas phage XPP4]AVO23993.1 terminase large subunit [Xanthomonas phage XPP6]AVO24028.1 terminase large subunit [Xanthomonas phage XPP8]
MTNVDPVAALIMAARTNYAAFVSATHRPRFIHSDFSYSVCKAVDDFVEDLIAGRRPILDLTAPPQFGKSSLISRCLPGYVIGRLGPVLGHCRVALSSYALPRAKANLRDARSIMCEPIYREIFPHASMLTFKGGRNTYDYFDHPYGFIKAQGVGGSLTGFSIDVGLNDDLTADAQDALSQTVQDGHQDWYATVFTTRLQQRSGQINMGTPWSANDIMARIKKVHEGKPNYRRLSYPALNYPGEIGYDPDLREGALVPELHSEEKLREIKASMSEAWWAAMYQQAPMSEMGAIFGKGGVRYYRQGELPTAFAQVIMTVDASFKGKETSDFCAIGVWGKTADNRVWLLAMRREKLAFTATAQAIVDLKAAYPQCTRIYIEDAANGPALIEMLGRHVQGIVGVPALGSKESRWHAVAGVWQSGQVMLPHPDDVPSIVPVVAEIVAAPDVRNDDAVDCMAMALYQLCMRNPISSMITQDILRLAAGGY